jgi:hypothetical protein
LAVWGIARACRADIAAAWLDQGGGADTDAQDDDEDLKSDPIAQIDLAVSDLLSHFIDAVRNTPPDSCITRTVRPTSRIFRSYHPQAHLTEMLRQCYASNANGMHEMVGALTEVEKGILRGVLTL